MRKKNDDDVKRQNFRVPLGLQYKLMQGSDERWLWTVKRYNSLIASGSDEDGKTARKQMRRALVAAIEAVSMTSAARAELRAKIKYWAQKRPYVVMHVFYRLSEGAESREVICRDAAAEERALHKREGKMAFPLPTNSAAKEPALLAGEIFDIATRLNLRGKAAYGWASNYFGHAFSHAGQTVDAVLDELFAKAGTKTSLKNAAESGYVEDEDDDAEVATPDSAGVDD